MSTLTETRTEPSSHERIDVQRTTLPRVIRSEWIKQRSLRSTWITLALLVAAIVGFGLLAAWMTGHSPDAGQGGPRDIAALDTVGITTAGAQFGVIIVAVLGVLVGAREFASGLIRTTLAAVPRRWPVLVSKIVVFVAIVLPAVLAAVLVTFVVGGALLSGAGIATVGLGDPGVLRALLGWAAYLVGIGVIGVALGVLLRSVGVGIGVLVGGIVFVPALLMALLPESWGAVLKYLPSSAGTAITSTVDNPELLGFAVGAGVFAAWIAVALVAAWAVLQRRDA
jgi:ABC-2 type transport system permease protein